MTPRSGSNLLCAALKATGLAGLPEGYYTSNHTEELLQRYQAKTVAEAQAQILKQGTSSNGRFGVKLTMGSSFARMVEVLERISPSIVSQAEERRLPYDPEMIRAAFPDLRCIFLTRRNKVRQAVSWWKARQSGQWVLREEDNKESHPGLFYHFDAIDSLVQEIVLREAGWQMFFETMEITPVTVVYEDLVSEFESTMCRVLHGLGLTEVAIPEGAKGIRRQADALSEVWVQRYREEKQMGWGDAGW